MSSDPPAQAAGTAAPASTAFSSKAGGNPVDNRGLGPAARFVLISATNSHACEKIAKVR
jgi:hypothetical protein